VVVELCSAKLVLQYVAEKAKKAGKVGRQELIGKAGLS